MLMNRFQRKFRKLWMFWCNLCWLISSVGLSLCVIANRAERFVHRAPATATSVELYKLLLFWIKSREEFQLQLAAFLSVSDVARLDSALCVSEIRPRFRENLRGLKIASCAHVEEKLCAWLLARDISVKVISMTWSRNLMRSKSILKYLRANARNAGMVEFDNCDFPSNSYARGVLKYLERNELSLSNILIDECNSCDKMAFTEHVLTAPAGRTVEPLQTFRVAADHQFDKRWLQKAIFNNQYILDLELVSVDNLSERLVCSALEVLTRLQSLVISPALTQSDLTLRTLATSCPDIMAVTMTGCGNQITDAGVMALCQHTSRLRQICLSGPYLAFSPAVVTAIATTLHDLQVLDVPFTSSSVLTVLRQWKPAFKMLIFNCQQLRVMRLNWVIVQVLAYRYPHYFGIFLSTLQKLVIEDEFIPLKDLLLSRVPRKATQVPGHAAFPDIFAVVAAGAKHLDLHLPVASAQAMIRALGSAPRLLEGITLTGCKYVSDEDLQQVVNNNPNLRKLAVMDGEFSSALSLQKLTLLDLRASWDVDDSAVVGWAATCFELQYLNLASAFLTDESIVALSLLCTRLEALDVRSSEDLSPKYLRMLVRRCRRLRHLVVHHSCMTQMEARFVEQGRVLGERLVIELVDAVIDVG